MNFGLFRDPLSNNELNLCSQLIAVILKPYV